MLGIEFDGRLIEDEEGGAVHGRASDIGEPPPAAGELSPELRRPLAKPCAFERVIHRLPGVPRSQSGEPGGEQQVLFDGQQSIDARFLEHESQAAADRRSAGDQVVAEHARRAADGPSSVASSSIVVVFPAPLGPSKPTDAPRATVSCSESRARVAP